MAFALRWPRPPDLSKLFVGQHVVNGVSVGVCVMTVALVAWATFGFAAGQPATLGAISASISDLPAPWREKARTMGFGFALALASTAAMQLALQWRGARRPRDDRRHQLRRRSCHRPRAMGGGGRHAGRHSDGVRAGIPARELFGSAANRAHAGRRRGGLYRACALATVFTDANARRLVASESIREFANYLRAVAAIYDPETDLEQAYGAAIREQAAISEQLQSARALLLDRPQGNPERLRLAATIGVLLDGFDALVAAQCDVALIRKTPTAGPLLARIRDALRVGALDLAHLSLELLTTEKPKLPPDHQVAIDALKRAAMRVEVYDATDPKARAALDAATARLVLALGHIRRLEKTLSSYDTALAVIGDVKLAAFIPKRSYALSALAPHFNPDSPVMRFAVRLTLAMMAGALVAQSLGDQRHGNWVLLTIAVVMRGGYGLTRQRRDDRVIGTLIGCVLAAGSVSYLPAGALVAVQGFAVAVTHSFARLNYRLASVGASVTALVSLHLVQPWVRRADFGAPRRHADRRGDRASLQLRLAALGIRPRRRGSRAASKPSLPPSPPSR